MKGILVIITFFVIYSSSEAESDGDYSLDSDIDEERNNISETQDFKEANFEFGNFTDESDDFDEVDRSSVVPILPKTEGEIPTSDFGLHVPEYRRKSQPRIENNTCGNPPSIKNAIIVGDKKSSYDPGDVIKYSCEFGYVADGGTRTVQCSNSLQWTQLTITCLPRSCEEPGYVNNANRIGSLFTFPNSVTYECEEGYKLRGISTRYCQPSGTWSGTLPSCHKIFCDAPQDIENGRVSYSSLEFGSELRYQCDNGFILRKHQLRVCSANGTWSGDDPVCQDFQCDPPDAPKHGSVQVIGGRSSVNSRVIYTCDGDRILVGSKTSICIETGEWTFPTPKCLDPCSVPEVPHGRIGRYEKYRRSQRFIELYVGSRVANSETLYLQCDRNYNPLGKYSTEQQITCNDGEWRDNPRCEPGPCTSDPPKTPNGNFAKINRQHGGGVVYHCLKYFNKTKFGNVSCNFGSWKGNTPVCSDTRCYANAISFPGLVKGNKKIYYNGHFFFPTCDSKYTAVKNNKITCRSGTWVGQFPPCTAASCQGDPPSIEHGRFKSYSALHSSVVTYECSEGFSLKESQSSNIQCLFGKWEGIPPTCKDSRCYQRNLNHTYGIIRNDVVTPSEAFLVVGCEEGFTSTGVEPYCSKGVWSEPSASCKEDNCLVYGIQNGHFFTKVERKKFGITFSSRIEKVSLGEVRLPLSSLHVKCDFPYTFEGKGWNEVEVSCSKGKWMPPPACLITGTVFTVESTAVEKPKIETQIRTSTRSPILTTQNSPFVIEAKLHRNTTDDLEESCTCTYVNWDARLVAYSGTELLQNESKVRNNYKVKFHCNPIGYSRLMGTSELVCKDCKRWHSSEYPQCVEPSQGDTIFEFANGNAVVLPGGAIAIEEGRTLSIRCIANHIERYPEWKVPNTENAWIVYKGEFDPKTNLMVHSAILNISIVNPKNSGKYECDVKGYRSNAVEIQVIRYAIQCSYIEETKDMSVHYDKGQAVNSSVFFSCKDNVSKLVGMSVLTCLPNGQWSGNPPHCKSEVKCPELKESEGLSITYTQGLAVDSTAVFHCFQPRINTGEVTSKCKMNGQWSNPVPSCLLPNCFVEALFRTELPENVISDDVEKLNSDKVPYNFTLRLKCEKEFILLGSEIARCGKDGNWEVPEVRCVLGCASLMSPGSSLIIEPDKSVYRFGEFVTLSCPEQQFLSSDVVRVMCLNNGWSESEMPHCQVQEM